MGFNELELLDVEIGDTVNVVDLETNEIANEVVVKQNKVLVYCYDQQKVKQYSVVSLQTKGGRYEILSLANNPIKLTKEDFSKVKNLLKAVKKDEV
jgi:hypothetical protein